MVTDAVWQVKTCAMKSATALIDQGVGEIGIIEDVKRLLSDSIRFPFLALKKMVVSLFLAAARRTGKVDGEFVSLILKQPARVQRHFLEDVVRHRMVAVVSLVRDQLPDLVSALTVSEQWRERLVLVQLLDDLGKMSESESIQAMFGDLCIKMLDDEASPVRRAAAEQLVGLGYVQSVGNEVPPVVNELLLHVNYRKRQSALLVLETLMQKMDKGDRGFLIAAVRKLAEDPCQNVVAFANSVLERIHA
jgi:hypothetical protein